jgi:hypothetical protein
MLLSLSEASRHRLMTAFIDMHGSRINQSVEASYGVRHPAAVAFCRPP